jgi:hypothetical protein
MPHTSAGSGPARAGSTADPPGGTSKEESCLTIRLPDLSPILNPHVSPPRESASNSSHSRQDESRQGNANRGARYAKAFLPVLTSLAASLAGPRQRTTDVFHAKVIPILRTRVLPFFCQPKFWLACVTAVAVQVVLAAVMPPAEDDPPEEIRTAANRWPKSTTVRSERIVVPPAQGSHDTIDPVDSGKQGTTTPLGVTAPLDSSAEGANSTEQTSTAADGVDEPPQAPRMAENHRLRAEGRQFDRVPAGDADGATLGGIEPLEPMADSHLHEPQR